MAKRDYAEGRKKHLKEYAQRKNMPIGGSWQGKGEYDYILKFTKDKNSARSKQNKYEMVCEYNILDSVDTTKFKQKDMHSFAHHLNSSQVLCYNFFRPYIDENGGALQSLVDLLLNQGVSIEQGAKCTFEYTDNLDKMEKKGDKPTEFDFHIIGSDVEVFFEIKYTENSFGDAKKDDNHKEKYELVYKPLLEKAPCLNHTPEFKEFAKLYQLYRNTVRITDKKKYLVLLYPGENESAAKQAKAFVETKVKPEYQENIKRVYWKKIVEEDSELYEKYFAE